MLPRNDMMRSAQRKRQCAPGQKRQKDAQNRKLLGRMDEDYWNEDQYTEDKASRDQSSQRNA